MCLQLSHLYSQIPNFFLVVISFLDNYVETPWSVIGALRKDLGISVSNLADDKEEDLRSIFSCWWSKELPEDKSFRRILCFEGSYKPSASPTSVIGEIFRCLVSVSKGQEITVMMPMIATGHQVSILSLPYQTLYFSLQRTTL